MPLELGRYGNRDIMDVSVLAYDKGNLTGALKWFMDYANSAENTWESEKVYARGGSGAPRRIGFNSSREGMVSLTTQLYSLQQLASLAGKDVISATSNIFRRDVKKVVDNVGTLEVTVDKTVVDATGDGTVNASDVLVYTYSNGIEDTANPVTVSSITGSTLVVTGVTAGTEVAVYYQWTTTSDAHKFTITADDFPDYCTIVGDTVFADEISGTMVDAQMIYYKAQLASNFSMSFSNTGDPSEITFEFDLFAVTKDGEEKMAEMILYKD